MKKNIKIFCLSALTVLMLVSSLSAEGTWTSYTADDGLADNYVWTVAVDNNNVKWFGTSEGVSSFDRTTWKIYTTEDGLPANSVGTIAVSADNVKWFGTSEGVTSFDGTTLTTYTEEDGLVYNYVKAIAVDVDNVKWFGTKYGVSSFDGTTWTTYTWVDGLAENSVSSIAVDADNVKWFATNKGVSSFDGTTWTTYTKNDGLASNNVYAIAVGTDNVKLFGTGFGVSSFDGTTWTTYNTITTDGEMPQNSIKGIAIDANNVKWIITYNSMSWVGSGVTSFDGTTWKTYKEKDGLINNTVTSIAVDADNVKWFGTADPTFHLGGVSSFDDNIVSVVNQSDLPAVMNILGNYPNPFNPSTTISFSIPEHGSVNLSVYDITGQKITILIDKFMNAGSHSVVFDGSDFGSGVYLYKLKSKGFNKTGKMLLMK